MNDKSDNPFLKVGEDSDGDKTLTGFTAEHYASMSDQRLQEKKQAGYQAPAPKPKPLVDPNEIKKIQFEHREKSPMPMILAGFAAVIAIGVSAYFFDDLRREEKKIEAIEKNTVKYIETNTKKEAELIKLAELALKEGRVDYPPRNNAIYYLAGVLENNRINGSAARMGQKLFDDNIAKARTAIESRDIKKATHLLNQASSLSYYLNYQKSREMIAPMRIAINQMAINQNI